MSVAIRAEHLSKEYRLGLINHGMLYKDMQSWMARKLGKPDPHAPIGAERYADQEDRFWALKDLSFDIEQGDRVGIIGKNGAGKSTLLKILSRITAPTEGCAKIKGRITSLLEVGTGFHGELTGRENIYLNGAILGMKRREIDKKMDDIISFSEIEQYIDTPVKRYSSGMYVRLAFAVAANLESDILIADEVLAVGDAAFQKKALGKMSELSSDQGRTILFVSHNMTAVQNLCNEGMLLNKGEIAFSGSISDTISKYLANPILEKKPISSCISIKPEAIDIKSIEINGQDTNEVTLSVPDCFLDIRVKGVLRQAAICNLELFFKDESFKPFAYFSPSHFRTDQFRPAGDFELHERIDLSRLTRGKYYIDFNIGVPRHGFLVSAPGALTIICEGVPTITSEYHPYEQVGYFILGDR
jgi:ABC-type polysaccharide/polyol phosphate transport system ATPase subunit